MSRSTCLAAALCAAAFVLSGCSKRPPPIVPAEGVVLLNGQPLPNALVQFIPLAEGVGAEQTASGITDENGRFQLTCSGQPGACACENIAVVVEAPMPGELRGKQNEEAKYYAGLKNRPIPERYHNTTKNPLVVSVTAGQSDYKLELQR